MKLFAVLAMAALALAQETMNPGSIEGVVRAEGDGPPLAEMDVRAGRTETKTDSAGRYTLHSILPGRQHVTVGARNRSSGAFGSRTVTVGPGQSVTADFSLPLRGTISGKVFDENDEPVPGVEVALIGREYGAGAIRYFRRNAARTNDEGEYRMPLPSRNCGVLQRFQPTIPAPVSPKAPRRLRCEEANIGKRLTSAFCGLHRTVSKRC